MSNAAYEHLQAVSQGREPVNPFRVAWGVHEGMRGTKWFMIGSDGAVLVNHTDARTGRAARSDRDRQSSARCVSIWSSLRRRNPARSAKWKSSSPCRCRTSDLSYAARTRSPPISTASTRTPRFNELQEKVP